MTTLVALPMAPQLHALPMAHLLRLQLHHVAAMTVVIVVIAIA